MKIDALQLANPVSFDFEVRSRVHWIYIGITIAVGLLFSYLVKVRLQQRIEFNQAYLDAQRLVERITQEEGRHADPAFGAAYRDKLNTLRDAMQGDGAADINTAKLALDTAWQADLQAFAKRHLDQVEALGKLREVTNYDWLVPPEAVKAVVNARGAQADVVRLVDRDDLTAAEERRREIIRQLGDAIRTAALSWQNNEQQILTVLLAGHTGISAANTGALTKPATDLMATLRKGRWKHTAGKHRKKSSKRSAISNSNEPFSVQQFVQWLSNAVQN